MFSGGAGAGAGASADVFLHAANPICWLHSHSSIFAQHRFYCRSWKLSRTLRGKKSSHSYRPDLSRHMKEAECGIYKNQSGDLEIRVRYN